MSLVVRWILPLSAVILIWACGGTLLWWNLDRRPPVVALKPPALLQAGSTEGGPFRRGEMVQVLMQVEKRRDCPGEVYRWIVGDGVHQLADRRDSYLPLGEHRYVVSFRVPEFLPPGSYRHQMVMVFHCNPVRPVSVTLPAASFEVSDEPALCRSSGASAAAGLAAALAQTSLPLRDDGGPPLADAEPETEDGNHDRLDR